MWDARLIKAYYHMEAMEIEGHPIWVEESPAISFEAKRRKIRSLAAVEAAQETHRKKKNPEKGVRFVAIAKLKPGVKWPTRADWIAKQNGTAQPDSEVDEKILARNKAQEERAKKKLAERGATVD